MERKFSGINKKHVKHILSHVLFLPPDIAAAPEDGIVCCLYKAAQRSAFNWICGSLTAAALKFI